MMAVARQAEVVADVAYGAEVIGALAGRIQGTLGIRMPAAKYRMLHGRLQRRVRELGLRSLAEYEAVLADPARGPGEEVALLDLATTNKTDFFREPKQLAHLVRVGLPDLLKGRGNAPLRVWCAGCSTGEEVYTLGILLAEFGGRDRPLDWSIWATDISTRALRHAAAATYAAELAEAIPEALRHRYFLRGTGAASGLVRAAPELRERVSFGRLNFMDSRYTTPGPFDVIFFRNVLIYFDRNTQAAVVRRQCEHLVRGGLLYVALAESLSGLDVPLTTIAASAYRRIP